MRRVCLSHALAVVFCSIFFLTSAHAQYRASIQGTVADPSGAVVPDATVTLTNQETGTASTTTTTGAGVYTFNALPPSTYSIKVEKAGFKQAMLDNIKILAEQANSVNITMEVGQATENVTVTDATPPIDTGTGNLEGTLSTKDIQELPSFGRDPYQLARLAPGVFGDGATNGSGSGRGMPGATQSSSGSTGSIFMTENQPQITSGGTRNNGNSYQIDGVEVNSLAWGGSAVITPNEEAVKQVQIQSNPYSAENGRNSGAQVLVVTKNGTNNLHGSAFIKIHRPGLDAFQAWYGAGSEKCPAPPAKCTPESRGLLRDANQFNQLGGSVGGPIIKNRLFFFFSYETLRNNVRGAGPRGWFDTPQFDSLVASTNPSSIGAQIAGLPGTSIKYTGIVQNADASGSQCNTVGLVEGTNCVTVRDSSGSIIGLNVGSPYATFNPAAGPTSPTSLGGGLCNNTTIPCIPDIFDVVTLQTNRNTATQWNGRTDLQVTNKDLVAFTVFWVPNDSTNFFNGPPRTNNLWNSDRLNYSFATLWNHTFGSTLINEARFNVTRWWFDEIKSNHQLAFGIPQISFLNLGLGVDNTGGEPNTPCRYCQLFGPAGPGVFYQTTYNVRDTLTKVYKSHSIKLGTDIYKEQDNDVTVWEGMPQYNFNNLWDFVNDAPNLEAGGFDPRTGIPHSSEKRVRSNIYGFFAQDDYKVKPRLTLNLGLRWEYFGPIHEKNGQLSTAVLGTGANTLTNLRMQVGGNMYHSSYHNFGPQIGFAWSPRSNNLVVRGGFGVAYNRLQEAVTLNGRFNPPLDEAFSLWSGCPGTLCGSNIFYSLANNIHDFNSYPSNPAAVLTFNPTTNLPNCAAPPTPTCSPVSVTAFDRNMPTPVVYRYSLELQRDVGARWVATLGYQGSQSRTFTRQINNLGWLFPSTQLNPEVGSVDFYTNDASGHYNALLARLQHQFSRQFSVDTQYVWSSCFDEGSSDYYSDPYPFDVRASLGHCDFDVTQNFKAYGTWSPHFFRGSHGWMEKTVGGWNFSGIFTYHTGFPFSPVFGGPVVNGQVVPAFYKGGAGTSFSNRTFESTGNFSQLASVNCSGTSPCTTFPYFGIPALNGSSLPTRPGVGRNTFRGPHYRDFDLTAMKEFGLPNTRVLGESARFAIRADIYNLFNTTNLAPIFGYQNVGSLSFNSGVTTVTGVNAGFGKATSALGARVVEGTLRFDF